MKGENAGYEDRIRASFAKQGLMSTLGATLTKVAPGFVEIAIRPAAAISQQHGFVHAGAVSAIADSAAGYAVLSLMPPDRGVLTAEFNINLVAPAAGERIVARGRVIKAGRTLTLAQTEVFAGEADRTVDRNDDGGGRAGRRQRLIGGFDPSMPCRSHPTRLAAMS
jgi:uncharacterized protein (TIGR00369 family)